MSSAAGLLAETEGFAIVNTIHVRDRRPRQRRRAVVRRRSVAVAAVVGMGLTGAALVWLGDGPAMGGAAQAPAVNVTHVAYPWAHPSKFRPTLGRPPLPIR